MSRREDTHTQLTDTKILDIVRRSIVLFDDRVKAKKVPVSATELIRLLEMEATLAKRTGTLEVVGTWLRTHERPHDLLDERLDDRLDDRV